MLTNLHIENFAIIDILDLELAPGLIVLTGETGAGKSIIIDAVNTLLGSRADSTMIRRGADRAIIEAAFEIPQTPNQAIQELLRKDDLLDDPSYILLAREIKRNGRSTARINGHAVNIKLLKEIGELLVDMHGQSDHLSLFKVDQHIKLLDRFAKTTPLLERYQTAFRKLREINRNLNALKQDELEAARKADLLSYQINEITAADLHIGEEESLTEERNRLSNAETLASACQEVLTLLDEGNPEVPSISDLFGQVFTTVQKIAKIDPAQEKMSEFTALIDGNLNELAHDIRNYLETTAYDPARLAWIEDRLNTIYNLKRKYGDSIGLILEYLQQAQDDLENITHAEEKIAQLEQEKQTLLKQILEHGIALSKARHQAARELQQLLENEFSELKMAHAKFKVDFQYHQSPDGVALPDGQVVGYDAFGLEAVEFLIETNPGEGFKPLAKIASGGETARIMLALKNVLAQADHIPTLIFDEIDQGIGGRIGTTVGRKLWKLTAQHQVICITHLPQLAAFGNIHLHVSKHFENNRTTTTVTRIAGEKRLFELAKMFGKPSEGTLKSAQELLHTVRQMTSGTTQDQSLPHHTNQTGEH